MKYLIPSERPDVWEFITHVFGNNILCMKNAVRHTWLLHRLCTSWHILARVYYVHGKNCQSLWKSLNFFLPPGSCLQKITKKLKAERRLTHRWIHLIVVQKKSALGSFATSSALTSAGNSSIGRALGCFSVFLRTHPSQTLFCTYH